MHSSRVNNHSIRALIIDLDGVIWRGEKLLTGVDSFFAELQRHALPFIFATNNASTTPKEICDRATAFGLDMHQDQILTSSQAAVKFLQDRFPNGASILVIGEEGIRHALLEASFKLVSISEDADAVVVGMDRKVSWEKMAEAAYALQRGALFLGTNSDTSFPTERGLAPGNGAVLHALQVTTGVHPIVVGKPEPFLFLQSLDKLGTQPHETLVVGDRMTTDIQGGINAGMLTALLLTGVTSLNDLSESDLEPDFVFNDLNDLIEDLWGRTEQD